jgi:AcrR family transcriptional regulator
MAVGAKAEEKPEGRPRAAHLGPERRRPLVLDTAYELFLEHGYDGTSMDAIAAAAGVSKPVVYDCFASKEELFSAMLDREEERIMGETRAALLTGGGTSDPEGTLIRGFTAFLRAVAASPKRYRIVFLGEGGGNDAVSARISAGIAEQAAAAAQIAQSWIERSANVSEDQSQDIADLLGQVIIGLSQAGARTLLQYPERWTPESLGEQLGRMAWASRGAV